MAGAAGRGEEWTWASEVLAWVQVMFHIWHAYREGTIDRETMALALEPDKDAIWECLLRGKDVPWPKARALSEDLMRLWDGL